ncbi:MAG TPA: hypothetical protein VM925_21450 [Labilithrix sp.]|nr:hypothetical protein [Labilithrix sp.]
MLRPSKLTRCGSCGGFLPAGVSTCLFCRAPTRSLFDRLRVGALGGALGGGAVAFTLMACYGAPPCDDGTRDCHDDDSADSGARDGTVADVEVHDASPDTASDATSADAATDGGDGG